MENNWWLEQGRYMELQARSENTRFFYQAIKKLYGPQKSRYVPQMIKTANGKILSSPTQVRERWKQYFSDLLSKECLTAVDLDKYIPDRLIQWQLNDPPMIEEIEKAFEQLNNHKMPGEDGIMGEVIEYCKPPTFLRIIREIYTEAWTTGNIPKLMCTTTLTPIFKKGDPLECNNYRGITNQGHILKALTKLCYKRIDDFCEKEGIYRETQAAFRRHRSRRDMIFIVRLIQTSFQEKNVPLFMAFIDIVKAYDSVQRHLIWKILRKIGLPPNLIRMLVTIYDAVETKIKLAGRTSEPFKVLVGLLQGDCNSTILFNIFFGVIIDIVHQRLDNLGIKLRVCLDNFFFKALTSKAKGNIITVLELLFADDTWFGADNPKDLQTVLNIFSEVCNWFGIKISVEKTEIMIQRPLNTPAQDIAFNIEESLLKMTNCFKYLGSMITDDALINKEISTRVKQACASYSKLYGRVWSRTSLSLKTKISTYKTCILPLLIQDSECWNCKKSHYKKLDGLQYKFLRTICGKKWEDFISYTDLMDILQQHDIHLLSVEILIRKKRLDFLQKILVMEDSRLVKQVAFSEALYGKRNCGRPLISWRQALNQDIKIFNLQHILNETLENQISALKPARLDNAAHEANKIWKLMRKQKSESRKIRKN